MASKQAIISSFIQSAPPGELSNVVADIKTLIGDDLQAYEPAFKKYHEEQYTVVKVPGGSGTVLLSQHNNLSSNRYFDPASQTSFTVDYLTQQTSSSQPHESTGSLAQSIQTAFAKSASEHFPSSTIGIYPAAAGSDTIAILIVANKYSPQNFWNGRWRSTYHLSPASKTLTGTIKVDVHYYEDGNVRMHTDKSVEISSGAEADAVIRGIAAAENKFQEELNRSFVTMAEGSFKGLRRQLPVTRQRVEWEKIGGYRLGQDIGGGRSK